jgi:hypothetical protein
LTSNAKTAKAAALPTMDFQTGTDSNGSGQVGVEGARQVR